eukprot:GFUD01011232.1.p1 GENE.GFUD01011232.1~~GFUD01011232.1.p1  ORF type:complete len:406 (-),score=119.29 GFUD01011232.1:484-1701(-)
MSRIGMKRGRNDTFSLEEIEIELEKVNPALNENNIILITVFNPIYTINVDTIYKVCRSSIEVVRIVIFERGQVVHALVEFKDNESAIEAKKSLHGCNIYSDSCTLKVEFARQEQLNVKSNGEKSWDFTKDDASKIQDGRRPSRKVLLEEGPPLAEFQFNQKHRQFEETMYKEERRNGVFEDMNRRRTQERFQNKSPVLIVYNLDPEKFNCQRLFNLLCLYGNIDRINFMKNKEGCAMVEFEDPEAAEEAAKNLDDTTIFGKSLTFDESKKAYVEEIRNPYELPDGEKSFENFIGDNNNRFNSPKQAAKNRRNPPSRTLHFYNVPSMDDDTFMDIFTNLHAPFPAGVTWFESKSAKVFTGLAEFDTREEACEALVMVNNTEIDSGDSDEERPYIMKLAFNKNQQRN